MLAARRLAVLLGLTAILALPSSGGAAAPSGGAAELRQQDTSLAAKERAATQELYSLEAQLAVARSRLAEADRPAGGRRGPPDAASGSSSTSPGIRLHRRGASRGQDPPALPAGAARPGGDPARRRVPRRGDRRAGRAPQHRLGRQGPAEQGPAGAGRADLDEAARGGPRRSAAGSRVGGGVDRLVPGGGACRARRLPRPAGEAARFNARRLERVRTTARAAGERTQELEASETTTLAAATSAPAPAPHRIRGASRR